MRRLTGWLALSSAAAVNAAAIAPAVSAEAATTQSTTVHSVAPAPSGRLKFRRPGPVCMCGDGPSEKDIEQALDKSPKTTPAARGHGQAGSQHENLNSGVPK